MTSIVFTLLQSYEHCDFLKLLGDVPEQEDEEDAELQASIASANKWRKMVALTKQRASQVLINTFKYLNAQKKYIYSIIIIMLSDAVNFV